MVLKRAADHDCCFPAQSDRFGLLGADYSGGKQAALRGELNEQDGLKFQQTWKKLLRPSAELDIAIGCISKDAASLIWG